MLVRLLKSQRWSDHADGWPRAQFNRIVVAAGLIVTPIVFLVDIGISALTGYDEVTLHQIPYAITVAVSYWQFRKPRPNAAWLLFPVALGMIGLHTWEMWYSVNVGGVSMGATTAVVVVVGVVSAASTPRAWPGPILGLALLVLVWGAWGGAQSGIGGFDAYLQGLLPALAIALGAALVHNLTSTLERAAAESRHVARYHAAISACADALKEPSDEVPDEALNALLDAANAASVFLTRNVEDPVMGLCSSMIAEVLADDVEPDPNDNWSMRPWTEIPYAFEALSEGRSIYYEIADAGPTERALYEGTGVHSECNIPIMIDGEWRGILGFSYVCAHQYDPSDFRLLETAAGLVGAFWKTADQRAELERLVKSKDELVAAVSHELRTPLTGILGFSEQLLESAPDENREFLELIAEQSRDMADIIEDLLVSARVEMGGVAVRAQAVDLGELARSVVDAIKLDMADVEIVLDTQSVDAAGDPVRIRQIIRNLVNNALRHGGATIHITASRRNGWATLDVWDNGTGLSDVEIERLFDRFYTGQRPRPQPGSVGLGLFLSRRLARLMAGDLGVRVDEEGTTFTLTLPITVPAPVDMQLAGQPD